MNQNNTIITPSDPKGYLVLPYEGSDSGYRSDILDRIRERMMYSLQEHSQILAVMLVIRFPECLTTEQNNNCFQYFIEEYRRILNTHEYDPHYIWVAERNVAYNHHYHLLLFLNGNKIRFFKLPPMEANTVWSRALYRFYGYTGSVQGLIHVGESSLNSFTCHGYLIHRNNPDMQEFALKHFSYYAKLHSKICFPDKVRVFGASQLRRG